MREKHCQELGVTEGFIIFFIIIILQEGGSFPVPGFNPPNNESTDSSGMYEGPPSATWGVFLMLTPASVLEWVQLPPAQGKSALWEHLHLSPHSRPSRPSARQPRHWTERGWESVLWFMKGVWLMANGRGSWPACKLAHRVFPAAGCPVSPVIPQWVGVSAGLSSCDMRWTNALSSMDSLESQGSGKTGRPESVTKDTIRQMVLKSLKQEERTWGRPEGGGLTREMRWPWSLPLRVKASRLGPPAEEESSLLIDGT